MVKKTIKMTLPIVRLAPPKVPEPVFDILILFYILFWYFYYFWIAKKIKEEIKIFLYQTKKCSITA